MTDRTDDAAAAARAPGGGSCATFADLVCADPRLLRIEFDAIIAANYPRGAGDLQVRAPRRGVAAGTGYRAPPPAGPRRPARRAVRAATRADRNPRARQRGPPGGSRSHHPTRHARR